MRNKLLLLAGMLTCLVPLAKAEAIPPWARKYNMNCSGCHYPIVPRLNARGLTFKWAGYRMPDEIGQNMEVKKIEEYLGAIGIIRYSYSKPDNESIDQNSISLPSASIFAAGALGKNYGAFLEFERGPEGAVDLIAQFGGVWGKENSFGGVRAGAGHLIVGGAIAGFDRPLGVTTPLPLELPTTAGSPFRFAGDVAGLEAFYVAGTRNRTSIQMVNGLRPAAGEGMESSPSTRMDWVVTNQYMWDDMGGGLTAVGYFGTINGLATAQPDLRSRYTRLGLSANKYVGPFEGLAGYVYSRDSGLPVGASSDFAARTLSGTGYWVSGAYTVPKNYATLYGRYELLDPDRNASNDAIKRIVFGTVIPFNVPEYMRFGVEYFRDLPPEAIGPRRNTVAAELRFAF